MWVPEEAFEHVKHAFPESAPGLQLSSGISSIKRAFNVLVTPKRGVTPFQSKQDSPVHSGVTRLEECSAFSLVADHCLEVSRESRQQALTEAQGKQSPLWPGTGTLSRCHDAEPIK
ncbi:uncharacterized protein GJ701_009301 [Geothlypis trichas]